MHYEFFDECDCLGWEPRTNIICGRDAAPFMLPFTSSARPCRTCCEPCCCIPCRPCPPEPPCPCCEAYFPQPSPMQP